MRMSRLQQNQAAKPRRKILLVSPYVPCRGVHGGGNLMFNLIRELSARHQITVLSFYEDEAESRYAEALVPFCSQIELVRRVQTFHLRDFLAVDPPAITYEFYSRRMQELIQQHLRSGAFDILQCEYLQTAHFARVSQTVPVVITNHEVSSLAYYSRFHDAGSLSLNKLTLLLRWMRMLNYEEKTLREASAVVVLTPAERQFLSRLLAGVPVYTHSMGVDCNHFSPGVSRHRERAVVFVGNFRHTPNELGVEWFLNRVWPKIIARCPHATFYAVGGNPSARLLARHKKDNVVMTGFVEDVRDFLARATVFVAPLFAGAGARTKVLEAWAMAKPVVGTTLAFEGLADEPTLRLTADDENTFTERVCALLENTNLAEQLGVAARQVVVQQFSWQSLAEFYEAVYTDILGSGGTSVPQKPSLALQTQLHENG